LTAAFSEGDLLCGRFRVVRFIARGGMGELYEARDLQLGEQIALKTIRADIAGDERIGQRFRREVQLARKVTHPNICRIFDLFQCELPGGGAAVDFVTMELLEGETLAERLRREGPYHPDQALPIIAQLAGALAAAHDAGIVHRDLKTNNVMLLPGDGRGAPRAVITDFGIAHYLAPGAADGSTTGIAGEVMGTPDYMAPEQIEGTAVSPATDVYSFGIVMYEMVSGVRPFVADTPIATALRRISGPPPRPVKELVPNLPPAWDTVIMRCLARQPRQRFADAGSILPALGVGPPASSRTLRPSLVAALIGLVGVLILGALVWRDLRPGGRARERTGASRNHEREAAGRRRARLSQPGEP
jgi:serine/threonine protein kinase